MIGGIFYLHKKNNLCFLGINTYLGSFWLWLDFFTSKNLKYFCPLCLTIYQRTNS